MGYWESLDQERRELQARLPWYKRDYVLHLAFLITVVLFFFESRYVLKAVLRHLLSYL
jgi:hypothetical protein